MCVPARVRTFTIEAASGNSDSIEVSISVSGPRGQDGSREAAWRGVAWRGLAWCGVPAVPCSLMRRTHAVRVSQRSAMRTCSIYRHVSHVYGAQRRGSRLEEMGLRDRPRVENRNII